MVNAEASGRVRYAALTSFVIAFLTAMLPVSTLGAASVTLAWDASAGTNIAGYNIYYGAASGNYTNLVPAGNATTAAVPGLKEGTTYFFAATAFDILGLESDYSSEISYTIPVVNSSNQPPTLNSIANLTINEDAGLQTVNLSGITSGATNENQTLTITAVSSNTGLIPNPAINYTSPNTTGALTFTPAANANGAATITVTVNDGQAQNNTVTRTFTVTVTPVNDAPTLNALANLTINEDAGAQTVALSGISSGAANENQPLTISASSSNPGLIPNPAVNYTSPNATGTLTFAPVANANGAATITVTVNDGQAQNNTVTRTFTVTVNPVNDPPTLDPIADLSLNANAGLQTVALTGISSGAANENQALAVTALSSNPGLIPNPAVNYTSPNASGSLTFTPVTDASGSATLTVTVNDGQAQNNIVTRSFTVNVGTVNQSPTISSIADQTILQDTSTGPIPFTISDAETAATNLTLSGSSAVPALVPNDNIVFGGSDSNRTVIVAPLPGQTGVVAITLFVSDGTASASTTFQLTVEANQGRPGPNTPPTISPLGDVVTLKNTPTPAIPFTVTDAESPASSLVVRASSSDPTVVPQGNIVLGGSGSNRSLTITPANGQTGVAKISVTVSDGLATTTAGFQIAVATAMNPRVTLKKNGAGTIAPDLSTQVLVAGQKYSVTATPATGQDFTGWTGSLTSAAPTLAFVLTTDLLLEANFVPVPFTPAGGNYYGLFYEADEVRLSSSGAFNIWVNQRGSYSGHLQIGTKRYAFSGYLGTRGQCTNVIKRLNLTPLTVEIQFGNADITDQLSGRVTDGTWSAELSGERATFNSRTNVPLCTGTYTLVLPGQPGNPALPAGSGSGTMRVSPSGTTTLAATLGDKTKISRSAPLTRHGMWPLYVALSANQGSVMSWLAFTNRASDDINGLVNWIKLPNARAKYYAGGFVTQCQAVGSVYLRPAPSNRVLHFDNPRVAFSGGSLSADFSNSISVALNNRVTNLSSNRLSLSFSLGLGTFRGAVTDPVTGKSSSYSGVVLQKQNTGYGSLLGADQTSQVTILP